MTYTVKQLAELAGVTSRTLRYYDQIGLLHPMTVNSSGYRIYGEKEVDMLQQILFFRELEVPLDTIRQILSQPDSDLLTMLATHHAALVAKRNRLNRLIKTVEKTIAAHKGEITMTQTEKFDAFKQEMVAKNEAAYGRQIRSDYGDKAADKANAAFLNMTEAAYQDHLKTEDELLALLAALDISQLPSEEAENIFLLHKKWLTAAWGDYSPEKHQGIAAMYAASEEFTDYYDSRAGKGATEKLQKIITFYAS